MLLRNVRVADTVTGADYLDPASFASQEAFAKAWTVYDNDMRGRAGVTDGGGRGRRLRLVHGTEDDLEG
ncbi:MAG TPA: hypothetical protein PLU38_02485 [Kiritimatiellia bacterium]|nr:hypothetical protein [Kiritimatiellia bacterium]HPO36593.1 hypothetical protein [Kiritimatiellia bacterium]HQA38325.1 hypothetical protein [Kiritimatiellia bacterium]HQQ90709.1 hypothetical protein [Kiritimatiellia bacterium]